MPCTSPASSCGEVRLTNMVVGDWISSDLLRSGSRVPQGTWAAPSSAHWAWRAGPRQVKASRLTRVLTQPCLVLCFPEVRSSGFTILLVFSLFVQHLYVTPVCACVVYLCVPVHNVPMHVFQEHGPCIQSMQSTPRPWTNTAGRP